MQCIYFYDSLLGRYALEETGEVLTRLWVGDRVPLIPAETEIKETPLIREAHSQLEAYFSGKLKFFSLPLLPQGTEFQLRVWSELEKIPYGKTITYGELACRIGNSNASRAVGAANGCNPLPIFIPCHRVVGAWGKLVGYTGGLDIKIKLLQLEKVYLDL